MKHNTMSLAIKETKEPPKLKNFFSKFMIFKSVSNKVRKMSERGRDKSKELTKLLTFLPLNFEKKSKKVNSFNSSASSRVILCLI